MKTATDLITEAKGRIREQSAKEVMARRAVEPNVLFIDCREHNEWNLGHAGGATFIPRGILESNIEAAATRDRPIVLYCASGNRSALAADTLRQMGYTNVVSMSGGFKGWVEAGGEVDG